MVFRRKNGIRGLQLILASTMVLTPLSTVAQPVSEVLTPLVASYSGTPTEDMCRQALSRFCRQIIGDFGNALDNGDFKSLNETYGNFYTELVYKNFNTSSEHYLGKPFENLSNEEMTRLYRLDGRDRRLDSIAQTVSMRLEMKQDPNGKEVMTATIPFELGKTPDESDRYILYFKGFEDYWSVERIDYERSVGGGGVEVRTVYDIHHPPGTPILTPEQERVEARKHEILRQMASTGWDTVAVKERMAAGQSVSDLNPANRNSSSPPTSQSPNNNSGDPSYQGNSDEEITSGGLGNIMYNFAIGSRKFDLFIGDVFRVKICEADLYNHPLESSRSTFYDFFVVKYEARSVSGEGPSFLEADDFILNANGRVVLSFAPKNSTRHGEGNMPPIEDRRPIYCSRVCTILNGSQDSGIVSRTNESSFDDGSLYVAYLTDITGLDWSNGNSIAGYLSQYYKLPINTSLVAKSDNGKVINIPPVSGARWVNEEDLQRQ